MKCRRVMRLLSLLAAGGLLSGPLSGADQSGPVQPSWRPVALNQVRLGGEIGRRFELTLRKNFLQLDLDRDFLRPLRQRHPKGQVKGFDTFIGDGTLSLAAVYFGFASDDPAIVARKDYLLGEILKTQSPSGYIGVFNEESDGSQLFTEYCLHEDAYLIWALVEDARLFDHPASLGAARRLADYILAQWPHRPPGDGFTTMGMEEGFESLYEATRDRRYLRFVSDETLGKRYAITPAPLSRWREELHPGRALTAAEIAAETGPHTHKFDYVHVGRLLAKTLAQVRLAELERGSDLLFMSDRLIGAMTDPTRPALLVTGAVSNRNEVWTGRQQGDGNVVETCTTAYEVWLLDALARLHGDLRYGDIMERALYNALFAAQDPGGRQICYFTPFSSQRNAFTRDTYCCPNNYRRVVADLGSLVYYESDDGVVIDLYGASTGKLSLPNGQRVVVRQTSDYPNRGDVVIALSGFSPSSFALRLRLPRWCQTPEVSVDGSPVPTGSAGQPYFELRRRWQSGDRVTLHLPRAARWVRGTQEQEGRAALLDGPLLYGLNPARNPGIPAAALRSIVLDPTSVMGPVHDTSVRPDGTAFHVKGWSSGAATDQPPDLNLMLTEFTDFGVQEVYFKLSDPARAVPDELLGRP